MDLAYEVHKAKMNLINTRPAHVEKPHTTVGYIMKNQIIKH